MDLVKFKSFYYRYKGNEEYALNNINLNIKDDSFILLCGETGSGKTTLIRCMNGLIPQFYAGFYKGTVEFWNGKTAIDTPIADLSTEIGIVFQNPENQLVAMNVEHEIAFGLENIGIPPKEISKRIQESASITEIEHILDKAPFELSGGEQQRVAIASVLVLEPKMLILDEPTALLDPYMAKKIINLLNEIKNEKNLSILISEHRLDLILPFSQQIILMKNGEILEYGETDHVINSTNFQLLQLNKPVIYSIFSILKKENLYDRNIPISLPEAIKSLK
jgi:energy-coupling factor transporter ATP-binding protein EcfA2